MSTSEGAAASTAFRWLAAHGVSTSRVVTKSFHSRGAGVGLAAHAALAAGEIALRVPRVVWWPLSAEAARERAQQRMPKMLERVDALVDSLGKRSVHLADSALLAAHLTLMALDENANNSYLRCLPVSLDVPILWPEALRKVLLQGSSCYASCQSQVAVSDKLFDAISGR